MHGREPKGSVTGPTLAAEQERLAVHVAGHALLLCRVYPPDDARRALTFNSVVAVPARMSEEFPLPEGVADDPWGDALVQLGGVAAEDVLFGLEDRRCLLESADARRAHRLLGGTDCDRRLQEAFASARELVDRDRDVLVSLATALLAHGALTGPQVWDVYTRFS